HLVRLADRSAGAEPTAELLARFAAGHDEEAFAHLVRRHGALVFGVCRRVGVHAPGGWEVTPQGGFNAKPGLSSRGSVPPSVLSSLVVRLVSLTLLTAQWLNRNCRLLSSAQKRSSAAWARSSASVR